MTIRLDLMLKKTFVVFVMATAQHVELLKEALTNCLVQVGLAVLTAFTMVVNYIACIVQKTSENISIKLLGRNFKYHNTIIAVNLLLSCFKPFKAPAVRVFSRC